jgi:hypothetical protein
MKAIGTTFALITIVLPFAIAWDAGLFRQVLDSRSVVEDGLIGADYWLVKVDGRPTDRIQHGQVVSRVPLALVEPGDRVLLLREGDSSANPTDGTFEWHARIENGVDYRIEKGTDGKPRLVAKD